MSSTERSTATGKPRPGVLHRGFMVATQAIDHRIGWDKLPKPLGLLVLIGLRDTLREKNLHDTNAAPAQNLPPIDPYTSAVLTARTPTELITTCPSHAWAWPVPGSAAISRSTKRGPKPTNG